MVYRRKPAKKQDVGSALKDVFGTLDYDDGDSGDEDAGLKEIAAEGEGKKKKEAIVYSSPREAILKRSDVKVAAQGQRMKCPWGKSSSLWPANVETFHYNMKSTSSKSVKKLLDFLADNDVAPTPSSSPQASASASASPEKNPTSSTTAWPKRSLSGQHKSKTPGSPTAAGSVNESNSSSPSRASTTAGHHDFPANVILHQMPLSELERVLCLGDAEVTVKYNSDESTGKGIALQSLELPDPYRPKGTPIPEKCLNIFLPTEVLLDDLKVAENRAGSGSSAQSSPQKKVEEETPGKKAEEEVTEEMKEKRRRKAERLKRENSGASAQEQSENQALKRLMSTQVDSDEDEDGGPSRASVGRRRNDALKSKTPQEEEPQPPVVEVASESSMQMPSPAKSETVSEAVKPATSMEEPRGGMYGVGTHPNWHTGHPENLSEAPSTGIDRINVPRLQGHKEIPFSAPGSSPGSRSNSPARRGLVDHNFASSRYGAGGIAYAARGVDHSFDEEGDHHPTNETREERELRERIIRELGGVPVNSSNNSHHSNSRDVSYGEIPSSSSSRPTASLFRVDQPLQLAPGVGRRSVSGAAPIGSSSSARSRSATSGIENRPAFRPTASPSPGWRNANSGGTPRRNASPGVASRQQGYSRSASARSASTQPLTRQSQVAVITLSQASGGGTVAVRSSTPQPQSDGRATLTLSRPSSPSPSGVGGGGMNRLSGMLKGSPIYMQQRYEAIRQDHASRTSRPAPAVSARLYQPPPSRSTPSSTSTPSGRGGVVPAGRPQIGAYQYRRY